MTFRLERLDVVDSTSSELLRRIDAGAAPGLALQARRQTGGRGRRGRAWQSAPGNLFLSASVGITDLRQAGHWSLLAAVALREAVAPAVPGAPLRLKWPNDLLAGGAKLAGILIEAVPAPPGVVLVIGYGVNIAEAPPLDRPTACLAALGAATSADALADTLLSRLAAWAARYRAEGFAPVREAWLAAGHASGERLTVQNGAARLTGDFAGIAPDGALLLACDGQITTVAGGEVLA